MNPVKIFVVFHKVLNEHLIFEPFSEAEICQWFYKYGVNSQIVDKRITLKNGHTFSPQNATAGVLLEYSLPNYSPQYQERGFMETSCYIHIEANQLYGDAQWVGVCQYDMRWTKEAANILRRLGRPAYPPNNFLERIRNLLPLANHDQTVFALIAGPFFKKNGQMNLMAGSKTSNWPFLIESYNRFFGTSWSMRDLNGQTLTLWQTYIMPRKLFSELAQWLTQLCQEVYPWANQAPYETHWGVLGGYTERAEGLFMALRQCAGEIKLKPLHLKHDETIPQQLEIFKSHYGR